MSGSVTLKRYHAKRRFDQTPEPRDTHQAIRGPLRFVVQKHRATRLHYDLRLEVAGTLKSWAVPKGPSLNPEEKRLAIMVEDHPVDYLHFEGVIPQGNYGAGTMMVWDSGTYHVPGVSNRDQSERSIKDGLHEGHLRLVLHGRKLKGEFALIRTKQRQENAWLLFRKSGGKGSVHLTPGPSPLGTPSDRSVASGRTMEEIAQGLKPRPRRDDLSAIDLDGAPRSTMPRNIDPMRAAPIARPFDHPDWLFEVKWDGYRAIAEVDAEKVRLYSRNQLSFEKRFSPIVDSLQHLGHQAVLDGEVVVLDDAGKPQFQLLQGYQKARRGLLVYQVFDLLYLDGHDLRKLPLIRRKEILAQLLDDLPNVRLSEHIHEHGVAFFQAVSERGLEGIVAKEARSRYREGPRNPFWLKVKTHLRQEAVIGGFTEPQGSRQGIGSLVLGVYEGNELIYIGHAGSGFTEQSLADTRSRLDGLTQKTCPFKKRPVTNAPVHWVQPRLVCEVSFGAWSDDGQMRHPVFLGLREDKPASSVHREHLVSVDSILSNSPVPPITANQPPDTRVHPQPTIGGHIVQLTNLDKVYWPKEGYTKGDLIRYYREVAPFVLPYLQDRPLSLHRHPNGIEGKSFFQKDMRRQPPPHWVQTIEITSESDGKQVQSALCQDEAALVYLANLGCIEFNPWNSRITALDKPDYVALDLDPENVAFEHVIEAAQAIHQVLEDAGVQSFCKTSGKRGLHVYVPFGARYHHEQAKQFAELIAHIVNVRLPSSTSLFRQPSGRQGRVYLDYIQNGKGKTLAAPYCVRPYPGATVSTPLKWREVRRGLDPARFTMRTLPRRLKTVGDLWQPILGPGMDLPAALRRLASLLKKP
jgi:bifunctional non-homologous end joining protein LigD